MAAYRFIGSPFGGVLLQRVADAATIPANPANRDYQDYLAWTQAGGVADPVPSGTAVVLSVRPVALRWALRQTPDPTGVHTNALEAVLAALASPGFTDANDAFEYMVTAERPDLLALCGALGFSTAQADAVLTLAASHAGAAALTS